ncbi:MAG: hypothetical protein LBL99_01350, partial [Holosporaceae bacterium]|nr:hypothetical protein [Holosporaceae bacterium]
MSSDKDKGFTKIIGGSKQDYEDKFSQLMNAFNESSYNENDVEFWYARDLQKLLDYKEWRNFIKVVDKAKTACKNSRFK